jgi:hypothetical protein
MSQPPQRRIVQSPAATLREILESQLCMLQAVGTQRPLDRDELQRLELLIKIYDRLPPDQQQNPTGITITVKPPTKKELESLLKIAETK